MTRAVSRRSAIIASLAVLSPFPAMAQSREYYVEDRFDGSDPVRVGPAEEASGRPLPAPRPLPRPQSSTPVVASEIPLAGEPLMLDNTMGLRPGDVLIRRSSRILYLGVDAHTVRAYRVAVGHRGAAWSGSAVVGRKTENPTWHPTANQRRKRRLPRVVRPGPSNPLGERAIYLFKDGRDTLYRIHGTNEPRSIGKAVSSGCIRMLNDDVIDLFDEIAIGATVTVA